MKIHIKIQISNKVVNALAKFFEPTLESIFETYIMSFEVKEQGDWLTEERKIDFQDKMNKEINDDQEYKIKSISVEN